ncbi:MAG: hypothetical protein AAF629_12085 [Chloroflexota bacterium]
MKRLPLQLMFIFLFYVVLSSACASAVSESVVMIPMPTLLSKLAMSPALTNTFSDLPLPESCRTPHLVAYMETMIADHRYEQGIQTIIAICDDPNLLTREGLVAQIVNELREKSIGPTYVIFTDEEPVGVGEWQVSIVQDGVRYTDEVITLRNAPFEIEVEMAYPHHIVWAVEPYSDSFYYNTIGIDISERMPYSGFNTLWSLQTMNLGTKEMPHLCRCLYPHGYVTQLLSPADWYEIRPNPDSDTFTFSLPIDRIVDKPLRELDGLHLFLQFFIDHNHNQVIDTGELHKIAITIDDPTATPSVEAMTWQNDITARLLEDATIEIARGNNRLLRYDTPVSIDEDGRWHNFPFELRILNLDADEELEIAAVVSTSGASCCTTLTVFDYQPETDTYLTTPSLWRKYTLGFRFRRNSASPLGLFQVVTLNENFNYGLGGASVVSFISPLQILELRAGELQDITHTYPQEIEDHIGAYFDSDGNLDCISYAVGAYLAEMAMLDRYEEGLAQARAMCDQWLQTEEWSLINETMIQYGYLPE